MYPGAGAQVVDVNYSNKGTRTGGVGTFSSMVVVGNYRVRLRVGRSGSAYREWPRPPAQGACWGRVYQSGWTCK